MLPAASVSGYYFAHPAAKYFVLGSVLSDQVKNYALRMNSNVENIQRQLVANLY